MQLIDGELLYDVADGDDEGVALPRLDDALEDSVPIRLLALVVARLVEQFLYDVSILLGQCLAHAASRIFGTHLAAYRDEPRQRRGVELREVLLTGLDDFKLLLGVVDERAQLAYLLTAQLVVVEFAYLSLDVARCIAQDVQESLMLSVYVGHEVLCSLGQVEYGLQVDDFRTGGLGGGVTA